VSEFRLLALTALREPEHVARTTMDDAKLNSLVVSIREVGILEPLLVLPHADGGFEVVAGHRRLKAARIAGLGEAPCIVVDDPESADAIKIHENIEREELSPADEAIFYAELYERHGEDTEAVAARVKRTRDHIEGRLILIRGDKHVFDALARGKISLGVAHELNKMELEKDIHFHLDYCVRTGASVAIARQWRSECNARAQLTQAAAEPGASPSTPNPEDEARRSQEAHAFAGAAPWELSSSKDERPCVFCQAPNQEWRMLKKHVCLACSENVWPRILKLFSETVL
jgi:ParB/RepB/Spo0J family partition protein